MKKSVLLVLTISTLLVGCGTVPEEEIVEEPGLIETISNELVSGLVETCVDSLMDSLLEGTDLAVTE